MISLYTNDTWAFGLTTATDSNERHFVVGQEISPQLASRYIDNLYMPMPSACNYILFASEYLSTKLFVRMYLSTHIRAKCFVSFFPII